MIARIWHAWTTPEQADAYEHLSCTVTIPAVEARAIAGLMQIDFLRRDVGGEDEGREVGGHKDGVREVEFTTILVFDTIDAVRRFVGDDVTAAQVPPAARALLARFDDRATHHDIIDRRCQTDHSRGRP